MTTVAKIKLLLLLTLLLAGTALSARKTNPKKVPKNAVLLSKVSAITVRAGKQTTSRRVSPVPQLQCVGPARICKLYKIDVMRCTNEGSDYDESNVQWSCKASLPEEFKLGSTEVTCEGYESSEDPYVLSGSCGVEYMLLLTEKGEEKYGSGSFFDFRGSRGSENTGEKYAGYLFMALFGLVLFIILRGLFNAWRSETPRRRPRGGGGFGGFGGGGDDNDPPPPYDPRPPPRPKKATWLSGSGSRSGNTGAGYQNQGWRPGFWTGTAAGAAAGYLAGRGARTQPDPPQTRPATGGWFGGGGGGVYGAAPRPGPSSSRTTSSSSSSYSSTRHESTGFGGTSRR
ncbi:uncharacterized protein Z519_10715 [Cladophialophora bantiana CBS 173.52]|uniref:Store-operated calcium entry-associated regulatory factor n=1 Tax=Cladophialophora bantiana (strain ATCC 10958 / CBS 173.52 / CDC B-1940 / NIH 8579) TaxID=1442370 RepID=A0A0D2HVR7_CLAB1|nr:uncharacterized protein Z519_10715 [Cladophialophora bantiana CBS 173.52]KIW88669.1 hypothetical protein Z519_10715 [Cladophialophora bantiana CBS 173.52]